MAPDVQLHSLKSSKRFRRKTYAGAPVGPGGQQHGSMLKWVVLAGITVVGLKWWHDKQRIDKAQATNQRLGTGHAKGWLAWLLGGQQRTLKYRGKAGSGSREGDCATADSANKDEAGASSPGTYDKATLQQFLDGRWTAVSRNAKVQFHADNGLEHLHIASSKHTLDTPVSSELQLRGSASEKTVKFTADGCFCSLEFPTKSAYQAFHDAFLHKLQQNQPVLLERTRTGEAASSSSNA